MIFTLLVFLFGLISYKFLIPYFRLIILDRPDSRKNHKRPTPSGGGLFFSIFGSILSVKDLNFIPLICLPLSLIGFLDDVKNLPNIVRIISHLITSILLIHFIDIEFITQFPFEIKFLMSIIISFCTVSLINFINFMDGMDGLVISNMFLVILTATISLNLSFYPFLALLLSFLLWNWHPAKIFMGDAGSTFLGSVYAGIILQAPNLLDLIGLVLILLPLIADPFSCIFKRIACKQPIFKAHTLHLYQRLYKSGMNPKKVCFIYLSATSTLCIAFLYLNISYLIVLSFLILLIGYLLDKNYALAFEK